MSIFGKRDKDKTLVIGRHLRLRQCTLTSSLLSRHGRLPGIAAPITALRGLIRTRWAPCQPIASLYLISLTSVCLSILVELKNSFGPGTTKLWPKRLQEDGRMLRTTLHRVLRLSQRIPIRPSLAQFHPRRLLPPNPHHQTYGQLRSSLEWPLDTPRAAIA